MFLGYQNNKIVLTANTREELENNKFMTFDDVVETDVNYTLYNGEYLTPQQVQEKQVTAQKAALIAELDEIDLKCIRSIRAIQAGTGTEEDTEKLAEYEAQAAQIRQQLQEL